MNRKIYLILLSSLIISPSWTKTFRDRLFYSNIYFNTATGLEYTDANTANPSAQVDLSALEVRPLFGSGLNIGMELFSQSLISFFIAADYNYSQSRTNNFNKTKIVIDSVALTSFYQKTRLNQLSGEIGLNINLESNNYLFQTYLSYSRGQAKRYDNIFYNSDTLPYYSRESKSNFDINKINAGLKIVSKEGYYSDFKLSLTNFIQKDQTNRITIDASSNQSNILSYESDQTSYSFKLGLGLYF